MKIQKAYTATDVHVAGEAFRIIKDAPFIHYQSLEQLDEQFFHAYADEIKLLLNEPRGFAGLNGCLVLPPINREADAAVVFFNHEGTVPFQFGGVVAVITTLLECGHLAPKDSNEYQLETVSGVVSVQAVMKDDEVISVKLKSQSAQIIQRNTEFNHAELQSKYSLVQADQLYAIFNKSDVPFELHLDDLAEVQKWGRTVNESLGQNKAIQRVVLLDDSLLNDGRIKTVTFQKDNFIVRSPGFGTAAACFTCLLTNSDFPMAQLCLNESIFNSSIQVEKAEQTESGYQFTFTSRGFITGMQTYVLDPTDPLSAGFLLK